MPLKIFYFASLRETLGTGGEQLDLPIGVADIGALRAHLAERGDRWHVLTQSKTLRAAVNQQMVGADARITDDDEIAFFPPVTGG